MPVLTGRLFRRKWNSRASGPQASNSCVSDLGEFQRDYPGWTLTQRQCCQAVFGQDEQLPVLVTADVLRHDLAFVQQA